MRPLHALVVLVLLAVLGTSAWYLIRADAAPGAAAPVAVAAAESDSARPAAETLRPAAADPASADTREERVASEPAAVVEEAPIAAAKSGPVLRGRVLDALGNAVPDATILAGTGGSFVVLPLDVELRAGAFGTKKEIARSGPDGTFAITSPGSGQVRLAVRKAGFAPWDRNQITVPSDGEHRLDDILLEESAVVRGRVVDSAGRGVAGARLERLANPDGPTFFSLGDGPPTVLLAESEADGSFVLDQLASGPFEIRVRTEDHPTAVLEGETSRPGEVVSGLIVSLEDGYEITGRVTGVPAGAATDVRVQARPKRDEASGEAQGLMVLESLDVPGGSRGGDETRRVDLGPDGSFAVRGLRGGRNYSVQARRKNGDYFSGSVSEAVVARAGERGVEISWQPESALVFQVVDARTREPLTEFRVSAGFGWAKPLLDPETNRLVTEHPEGRVRYGDLRPRRAGQEAELVVEAKGYAAHEEQAIPVDPGIEVDLGVIALEPVPVVRVTVLDDATGQPVSGASVVLRKEERPAPGGRTVVRSLAVNVDVEDNGDGEVFFDDGSSHHGVTDEHGVAVLNAFAGESGRLTARHREYARHVGDAFEMHASDPTEQTVRLREGGSVEVTVVDAAGEPTPGVRVQHRAPGGSGSPFLDHGPGGPGEDVTDSAGRVVFAHLEPGTHRFRSAKPSGGGATFVSSSVFVGGAAPRDDSWTEVDVVDRERAAVTLKAPVVVELTGTVRETGEALSGAQVRLVKKRDEGEGEFGAMHLPGFGGGGSARTDGRGRYVLEGVEPGDYELVVEHASRQMPSRFELTVLDVPRDFDVDLPVSFLEGRVTDEQGRPLAGVRVWPEPAKAERRGPAGGMRIAIMVQDDGDGEDVMISHGGGFGGETPRATTDEDGRYSLRGVRSGVELQVVALADKLQPERSDPVQVAPNEVRRGVDLVLRAAGSIEVLANRRGAPASNLLVTAHFEGALDDGEEPVEPQTSFLRNGRTTLEGLRPGPWRLTARGVTGGATQDPLERNATVVIGEQATVTFEVD